MKVDHIVPRVAFRKILYVTDLSENGRQAFPYAASIAHIYGADLTVFHVVESHDFEKHLVGYIDERLWNEIKQRSLEEAREILIKRKRDDTAIRSHIEAHCREAMPSDNDLYVSYDVDVSIGEPVNEILAKVQRDGYDLIVVSRHGHGVLKGGLIGDTAQRVIRRTNAPVLVVEVPPEEE
jgi:nucleotide-binding universal stress UspA family protein